MNISGSESDQKPVYTLNMEIRFENSPQETAGMNTENLRNQFLLQNLMVDDGLRLVYSHFDRLIIGGARPVSEKILLENPQELRADHFLERREMGIVNLGGPGAIEAEGQTQVLGKLDALYLGKGTRNVWFASKDAANPAVFYLISAPAHAGFPNASLSKAASSPVVLGAAANSNRRTVYKYIHAEGIQSCQLVMGLTVLEQGSVWNSMPPHTHTRRTEVYFYFDLAEDQRIMHFMGEPEQTRHLVVSNHEAVISPPWSVHFGCGTSHYGFVWAMAGENKQYTDMDALTPPQLR